LETEEEEDEGDELMLKMQDNMDDEEGEDLEDSLLNQMKQP
jgi:hypothetical protein